MTPDPSKILQAGGRLASLGPAFRRLDTLIGRAIKAAEAVHGPGASTDPYRGLYVSLEEATQMLGRAPSAPLLTGSEPFETSALQGVWDQPSPFARLANAFGLTPFDLDVTLFAVAPEMDLRYERLYAYLQDDVTRRRPSIDLVLNVLCASSAEKLFRQAHFTAEAPLLHNGILEFNPEPNGSNPVLLARSFRLDDQVVAFLLGRDVLDPRLGPWRPTGPDTRLDRPLPDEATLALAALVKEAAASRRPLRLYFHGPPGVGKSLAAESVAIEAGASLLAIDLDAALRGSPDFAATIAAAFRHAALHESMLYFNGVDTLAAPERILERRRFDELLAEHPGAVVLVGASAPEVGGWEAHGAISVAFPFPDFWRRRSVWQAETEAAGVEVGPEELDALADRFRLAPGQICRAVAAGISEGRWRNALASGGQANATLTVDFFAAARAQSGKDLAAMARKIEPRYRLEDLVLPEDQKEQLKELERRVSYRHAVYDGWGFDAKLSLGKGTSALFCGPPGTGKTMAAEVMASGLQVGLYKIDLSQVVSKYIGETEKNLDRIFEAAHSANAILFFDEADALFGKRSEVKDAHDRYANIEVSYLLQKMEEYEGIAILATNLRQNLDDAFVRRMQAIVEFPFPDEEHRLGIWKGIFPAAAPLDSDVDFRVLARDVRLAGGNIKNIALAAAFYAAAAGGSIRMEHLLLASRREHEKMGRSWEM